MPAGEVAHQYSYSGSGSDPGSCVPVRNTTTSIPGPNGKSVYSINSHIKAKLLLAGITAISVIEKCSCESSCYRFSHHEAFLERNEDSYPEITEKANCACTHDHI